MAVKMRIEGAGDIERALAALPRGTAKGVMRRAMKKSLKPVAQMAEGVSPFTIAVTSKLTARQQREALPVQQVARLRRQRQQADHEIAGAQALVQA